MKTHIKTILACALATMTLANVQAKPTTAEEVRQIIDKVNQHWQSTVTPDGNSFWDNAAYHTGNMEAYYLTGNEDYLNYSLAWAEHNEWQGAKSTDKTEWRKDYGENDKHVLFGDWQICFQTY